MRAEFLSLPELRDYLHFNSDFPHSLARAFCDAFSISHRAALDLSWSLSRRAARHRLLSQRRSFQCRLRDRSRVFAMNFLTHLFLALGEGDRIAALGSPPGRRTFSLPRSVWSCFICARPIATPAALNPFANRAGDRAMNPLANDGRSNIAPTPARTRSAPSSRANNFTPCFFAKATVIAAKI